MQNACRDENGSERRGPPAQGRGAPGGPAAMGEWPSSRLFTSPYQGSLLLYSRLQISGQEVEVLAGTDGAIVGAKDVVVDQLFEGRVEQAELPAD